MRERPCDLSDEELASALADGWGIEASRLAHRPVGAGGHHWSAGPFFVTVAERSAGLEQALETAFTLHTVLNSVVAPIRARDGRLVRPLKDRYALSLFPRLQGRGGEFGPHRPADRTAVLDLLRDLHRATPAVAATAPRADLRLPGRADLTAALAGLDNPWTAGPYAEAARRLLIRHARRVVERLARLDALTALLPPVSDWVITHGEPHPGNIMWTAEGPRLIDWDTVQLAPAERDLWMLTGAMIDAPEPAGAELPPGVEFYRHWWILADIANYTGDLRRSHTEGADNAAALSYLAANLRGPW
ncbi:aminoglycoside phosphotransferase family protein [Actinoplanes sp. NPDC049596]|uniref:aminoglycoside phosphotransferase family protein n=1 Tax=unclassified Actinoplanes TaxID=2626549 RepID=UPI003432E306